MSDRFFVSFVAGMGVFFGAYVGAPTLPLSLIDALAVTVGAILVTAFVYWSIPLVELVE